MKDDNIGVPKRVFLSALLAIGIPCIVCICVYLDALFTNAYHFGSGNIVTLFLFRLAIGLLLALCAYPVISSSVRRMPHIATWYAVGLALFVVMLLVRPDIMLGGYMPMFFAALYVICLSLSVAFSKKSTTH